ncbi:hypothetical protein AGDE_04690 [Angomonas deanei]|uniref:Uncharacterized protein n=1 Tax=Angomonas deanei TaxID=59799 RepID=A0A7G2CK73_9TRYP|nr:hypothetical protein AGDE_04690 [Angomonas deanei]CAD2220280.1 hypothetical protein, conserved [Angomonas deanei]|eukprot:EPY39238.1 hypothetical protein AGDE_04690 [Angomonas deanei]
MLPGSRAKQQAAEISFQHLIRTEKVVRLEAERREAKARLRLLDLMTEVLDDQLVYVAQFKKIWLLQRAQLEEERQDVLSLENEERVKIEKLYSSEANEIIRKYYPS